MAGIYVNAKAKRRHHFIIINWLLSISIEYTHRDSIYLYKYRERERERERERFKSFVIFFTSVTIILMIYKLLILRVNLTIHEMYFCVCKHMYHV